VASITTLAVHDGNERCTYCRNFHTVEAGGPAAALATAIRYLDAYHQQDHVRKVQSDIRGLPGDQATDAARFPETRFRPILDGDIPPRTEMTVRQTGGHL
jgi:hypothetical protein